LHHRLPVTTRAEQVASINRTGPMMTRRRFIRLLSGVAGLYVVGRSTYFAVWERYDLRVTAWDVPLPRLPEQLNGLRIAHIADVHLCPELPYDYVASTMRLLSELGADALVFTGDLLSVGPKYLSAYLSMFSQPQAPSGKYAVLGNHDFVCNRSGPVTEFLHDAGWQVLRNRSVPLLGADGAVWVAGVEDMSTGRPNLQKALNGIPERAVRILLAHQPDFIDKAAPAGVDLMLCGHTHGGQVVLPLLGPPVVPSRYGARYAWGLFDRDGTRMQVTRGVGMISPRIRFNCPPEIAVLTLRRGDGKLPEGRAKRNLLPDLRWLRRKLDRDTGRSDIVRTNASDHNGAERRLNRESDMYYA